VAAPRQELDNYRAWHARHGTARPVFQLAFRWLADHSSTAPVELTLVHGDFRNGNLLVHPERGLVAVLDWELAHVGDPVSDLGWMCVNSWRYGERGKVVGGFGDVAGLLEGYRSAGGREVDAQHLFWWQVMGTLKWGVICESMVHAWLVGEDDQIERAAVGRRASEAEIDLLELLAPGARAVR
jgi:aminoglycoside phosphotransferase (APT) family kinase protein